MAEITLPNSVRYVKNGAGSRWWPAAHDHNQIHAGWKCVPRELLLTPNFPTIRQIIKAEFGLKKGAAQRDYNALCALLDAPNEHIWITIQDGFMWWCTARVGAILNPVEESRQKGNFWLACDRPWSNRSLKLPWFKPKTRLR